MTSSFSGIAVTTASKKFALGAAAAADGVEAGDLVYDSAGVIPLGDPVKTFNSVDAARSSCGEGATGNSASDTITVVTNRPER